MMLFQMVFLFQGSGEIPLFQRACSQLPKPVGERITAAFFDVLQLRDNHGQWRRCVEAVKDADFLFFGADDAQAGIGGLHPLQEQFLGRAPTFIASEHMNCRADVRRKSALSPVLAQTLTRLYGGGDADAVREMLLLIIRELGDLPRISDGPQTPPHDAGLRKPETPHSGEMSFAVTAGQGSISPLY